MVEETIRSIKEAEQQAEDCLRQAQEQSEQILKDGALKAKQIREEILEEAKKKAAGLDVETRQEAEKQQEKETEKLAILVEELKAAAREKKEEAVQMVLSELI